MVAKVVVKYVPIKSGVTLANAVTAAFNDALLENPGASVSKTDLIPKANNTFMLLVGFDFAGGGSVPSVPGSNVGPYIASVPYVIGDVVNYEGTLYVSIQDGTGQQPDTSPAYWLPQAGGNVVIDTRAPLATDDTYAIGTIWVNTGVTAYICTFNGPSSALWVAMGSGGSAVNGGAFITDCVPQTTGNVSDKVFSSNGAVLESFTTDTQLVTISVLAVTGNSNYIPIVTVAGTPVTLSDESDAPIFRGSVNIDLASAATITVTHEDGATHTTTVTYEALPDVLSANFTGGYPGSQTELKEDDTYAFQITSDVPVVKIQFDDYGAFKPQEFTFAENTTFSIPAVAIANRGTVAALYGANVRVQKSNGSWSDWYLTTSTGSIEGVNVVNLNNLFPSISFGSIVYPGTQTALKDSETAIVGNTAANYDTILYSSPNGDLSIAADTTYAASKTVTRINGSYNVSVTNLRIVATRAANDSVLQANTIVNIAHVAPVITIAIVGEPSRLRSGGRNGTVAQNYAIQIISDQALPSAPSITAPVGVFQGGGFTGGPSVWVRNLQIHDDYPKGAYTFGNLSAIGKAGVEQTSISDGANYDIGGFVSRVIALPAFWTEASFDTEAILYNKVTMSWSFSDSVVTRAAVNSSRIIPGAWCLVALGYGVNPTTVRILDELTDAASFYEFTYITIEEVV